MAKQFWNDESTKNSLAVLRKLTGKIDFVLIGGWAVNFYTKLQRSLDVDMAIDYKTLDFFREFGIEQYGELNIKYSIIDSIYVDLFIDGFSDNELPFPVKDIMENYEVIDNIRVVERELLLLLKLCGYFRQDKLKHQKDIVDVVGLLLLKDMDFAKLGRHIRRFGIPARTGTDAMLEYLDIGETLLEYLGVGKAEYSERKSEIKAKIKSIAT
jgi:hypothetical protein